MEIENLCNFYASKYHLSIILLEYLNSKNTKKSTVITFLQNGIEEEINILKEKYKFNINSANEANFEDTKVIKNKKIEKSKDIIFIIDGDVKYMKEANSYIKKEISKLNIRTIKIINCFDFEKQQIFMEEILNCNDKILYTTGEKVID